MRSVLLSRCCVPTAKASPMTHFKDYDEWMDIKECWSTLLPHPTYQLGGADVPRAEQVTIQIEKHETSDSQVLLHKADKNSVVLTVRITTEAAA